jgi:ribose transport system ATP-binding protein
MTNEASTRDVSSDAAVLTIAGLSKTFPGVRALKNASLEIKPGEIHALVGQNGSGKSTLIKVLAGVHQPDSGVATVSGNELQLGSGRAAHELGIRFVHQDLGLIDNLSSVDNLALGFGYTTGPGGRIRWSAQREKAREVISHVVDDFPVDALVSGLSVFQRTALAIARALQDWRENGSLLVLDEPTATMPRGQVEHLFSLLRRIRDRGTPVLLVTHHLEEVFAVADRVTILRDGEVITTAAASTLNTAELVSLMTGGVDRTLERPRSTVVGSGDVVMSLRDVSGGVVEKVDLELRRGEILGIAGLSGSGREEVCSLIFGSARRGGEVTVEGRVISTLRPEQSIRRGVGLVPANRHRQGLVMTQSVRRNLTLSSLADFVTWGRVRQGSEIEATKRAVARFGVKTPSTESPVAALSGGNQQKVVLAKWLRTNPTVLLLDEPTQGVDVAAQADLHQLLLEAASNGTAILVCSSDELELSAICDRVLVMNQGRIEFELSRDHATAERIFEATIHVAPVS